MATASGGADVPNKEKRPAPARKRRRRTAATGAAQDCFTCIKRQTDCDRVRPFCGQCLEMGQKCSGYATTLTWGVGVASRGKLRGLSLPVAAPALKPDVSSGGSKPRPSSPQPPSAQEPQTWTQDTQTSLHKRKRSDGNTEPDSQTNIPRSNDQAPHTFDTYPEPRGQRASIPSSTERSKSFTSQPHFDHNLNLHFSADVPHTDQYPSLPTPTLSSSHTGTSYSNSPWEVQSENSANSESPTFVDPFEHPQHHHQQRNNSYPFTSPSSRTNPPPHLLYPPSLLSPGTRSEFASWDHGPLPSHNLPTPDEPHTASSASYDQGPVWSFTFSPESNKSSSQQDRYRDSEHEWHDRRPMSNALVHSVPRSAFDVPFFHLPRRMQGLLDYYDKAICPVLVAFDDRSNPYRHHVMHLAMQSTGLQYALAALVTNNMRMKKFKHVPRLKQEAEVESASDRSKPTQEEQHYKAMSIQHLNAQLADVSKASSDSVLATLLILCLFHVCNSGFSKFKTQLAGVQKLLRMRTREVRSEFVGWVEMFFAWFDVMTSAVNDRETEIRGDSLDMMDLTANLGALERFSGCDGRLFKLIARLGRLNLLSQRRPVRFDPTFQTARPRRANSSDNQDGTGSDTDSREMFWTEWHDLRERLYSWRFTPQPMDESDNMALTQQNLEDISESFRYSALLYTERLGYPHLPSSSGNFQDLVRRSLTYIVAIGVNSCVTKFMLWPLFITGTECVAEQDRDLIRDRCVEIKEESGFYNNLSGLHVLERVWHENDTNGATSPMYAGQAFRWRKAMDRVDGEYIVI